MTADATAEGKRAAVLLLSGGLDSATTMAVARADGFAVHALTVDYGQRHRFELAAARQVAAALGAASHLTVTVDMGRLGGSALISAIDVPKNRSPAEMEQGIPVTYVPARNTVLLSLALAHAEVLGAADLYLGVNAVDYSGYPDCRPEYIAAFQRLAQLATKAGVEGAQQFRVRTPLIDLSKAEIIQLGNSLGVDFGLTHTCYSPNAEGTACGVCDACQLRRRGFEEAGCQDPIAYSD